ncbi:uncharacterized protein [Dysidea avara]|uniref:uncharacterized protein n=1 Tax=Dysidea avara TaxID=196820 RepID=UPI00331888EE
MADSAVGFLQVALGMALLAFSSGSLITVNSNGNDSRACLLEPGLPCCTLEYALNHVSTSSLVVITSDVTISKPVTISDIMNITIAGSNLVYINCSGDDGGIAFIGVINVTLTNLSFLNCGAQRNSTSHYFDSTTLKFDPTTVALFTSALYFKQCSDVTMHLVSVVGTKGIGVTLYNVDGIVTINNSSFINNSFTNITSGGGIYVEYCENGAGCNKNNSYATYTISDCVFKNNKAHMNKTLTRTAFIEPFSGIHYAFGRGGGLSFYFRGSSFNNFIMIRNCNFIGNTAVWGAGLFAEFMDWSSGNNVTVIDSNFIHNYCPYDTLTTIYSGTGGGGTRVNFAFHNETHSPHNNNIQFTGCYYNNNEAWYGGGVSYYTFMERPTEARPISSQTNKLSFLSCSWIGNKARLGAAAYLSVWESLPNGFLSSPIFDNCSFFSNTVNSSMNGHVQQLGVGAVYVDSLIISLVNAVTFTANTGTAIVGHNAGFNVHSGCEVAFYNNTGIQGGAISLYSSWIQADQDSTIKFVHNYAFDQGGAIFAQLIGGERQISERNCFIRYNNLSVLPQHWKANYTFVANCAGNGGHSIFATTLASCVWFNNNGDNSNSSLNVTKLLQRVFMWENVFSYDSCSCEVDDCYHIATEATQFSVKNTTLNLYPGKSQILEVGIKDDRNQPSNVVFVTQLSNGDHNRTATIDPRYRYVSNPAILLYGEPHTIVTLSLQHNGAQKTLSYTVKFLDCPIGFFLDNYTCNCTADSEDRFIPGIERCDSHSYTSYVENFYWVGFVNNKMATVYCPLGYCARNTNSFLRRLQPNESDSSETIFCAPVNRMGQVCGECKEDFGVAANSDERKCIKCQNGKHFGLLLFIIYEILPLLLFFMLLLYFNITLTSGYFTGFIFYAQVLRAMNIYANNAIVTTKLQDVLITTYRFLYGMWSLDFIETITPEYCILHGMNTLDVLVFDYLIALLPLLIVVVLFLLTNYGYILLKPFKLVKLSCCCTRLRKCFQNIDRHLRGHQHSLFIHGIASFLVLSYAKFILISFDILRPVHASGFGGKSVATLVFLDGTSQYFGNKHCLYAIPALLALCIFVIPIPLVLILTPFLYKLQCAKCPCKLRRVWSYFPTTKFKQFLEEFYGPYEQKYCFYAGVLFLYRVLLFVTNNAADSLGFQYVCQQILLIFFIIIQTIVQPYSTMYNIANKLDTLIFCNLALINALTIYNYYSVLNVSDQTEVALWAQLVLIYIPLVGLIVKVILSLKYKWFVCRLQPESRDNMDNTNVYFLIESNRNMLAKEFENSTLPVAIKESNSSFIEPSPHHKTI